MDLKERLKRLDSIAGGTQQVREEIISDLRKRLERLTDPRRKRWNKESATPVEEAVPGEEVNTPWGQVFVSQKIYGSGYRHGGVLLDRVMEIPTDPVSLVSRDESLLDLDFSQTLFLDIETTGLAGGTGTYAFLVGVGYFEGGGFITKQFFLRDFSEERAMLWLLSDLANRFRFLATFNGKRFDIPLLETRFIISRMDNPFADRPNYDLLFPSRRIWKGIYEDCRLATLESCVLDIDREDDVPSEMIPQFYFDYLQDGDARRIQRVFYHNRIDVLSLVTLAARIHELVHAPETASRREWGEGYSLGKLFSQHKRMREAIECFQGALKVCKVSGEWDVMKSLSLAMKREGQIEKAASIWMEMISFDGGRELFAYEELAKYYEHHVRDFGAALKWVGEAFEKCSPVSSAETASLRHRYQRLLGRAEGKRIRENQKRRRRPHVLTSEDES
jgi:uncharacterized protein YprB with RNaseH-like and TPR domain